MYGEGEGRRRGKSMREIKLGKNGMLAKAHKNFDYKEQINFFSLLLPRWLVYCSLKNDIKVIKNCLLLCLQKSANLRFFYMGRLPRREVSVLFPHTNTQFETPCELFCDDFVCVLHSSSHTSLYYFHFLELKATMNVKILPISLFVS